jgi:endonuclease/exonuclease/phosphatase family metal-dependent hydrolase
MPPYKVLSFNVLSDEYIEFNNPVFLKRWYPGIKASELLLKNRVATIIATLKYMDADIICLQEVMVKLRVLLVKIFPDYYVSSLAKHTFGEKKTGNLVMLKKSKFEANTVVEAMSDIGKGYHQMTVLAKPIVGGKPRTKPIVVCSLHLSDTTAKYGQAKVVSELLSIYKGKVIVAGDFNTNNEKLHAIFTGLGFKSGIHANTKHRGTYLCEKPMIDYIYASGFKKIVASVYNEPTKCTAAVCYISTIKKYGTDHYPIYATVI